MNFGEIVSGKSQRWRLVEKLGEGDAGEVYLVESLLARDAAIIKRPHREALTNEILRQAAQIRTEGRILHALRVYLLSGLEGIAAVPEVMDTSPDDATFGEQFFLVIQKASGMDLQSLSRAVHFGHIPDDFLQGLSIAERQFINRAIERGKIPEILLLRSLYSLIQLFEKIHFLEVSVEGDQYAGIIWNDIKPDHIFWNPQLSQFTFIDWGNSRFLNAEGITEGRQASRLDDYDQFLQAMGRFLQEAGPELYRLLEWPEDISHTNAYSDGVKPLAARIEHALEEKLAELREIRRKESDLLGINQPDLKDLNELVEIQYTILDSGELPDYQSTSRFYTRLVGQLAGQGEIEAALSVCEKAAQLPDSETEKWALISQIGKIAETQPEEKRKEFGAALAFASVDNWGNALWELLKSIPADSSLPPWWEEVSSGMRRIRLQIDPENLAPYVTLSRLYYTLQAAARTGMRNGNTHSGANEQKVEAVLRLFEEEVVKKWKQAEPDPPNSGIEYKDITSLIEAIDEILPGTLASLEQAFSQPKAQVQMIMDAWGYKDFELARRGLRQLLLWDPHRRRILLADRAMQRVVQWLARIRRGPESTEVLQDYLPEMELSGREIRNQVGAARWLDLILSALKELRSGNRPADLLMDHPELLNEMPWLNEARSRETISLPHKQPLILDQETSLPPVTPLVRGVKEGTLGKQKDLYLEEPLDTWTPEAQGSSARVFSGTFTDEQGRPSSLAVKIMRPDRQEYAIPLFREEASILTLLRDVPGVTRLVEVGFLMPGEANFLIEVSKKSVPSTQNGQIQRYGVDQVQSFLSAMDSKIEQGWLPYLALEKRHQSNNLMVYCDAGSTRGRFLPLPESLFLAIQMCDIIQTAHNRNIAYRDHKILHYYWDPDTASVWTIDWNIARRYPQGISAIERQLDLVQFGARALHHILTGRPAPGALPLGPNRPEEIEQASHSYKTQWTYDDERLPNRVKEILEIVLDQGYKEFRELRRDLLQVYEQITDTIPEGSSAP